MFHRHHHNSPFWANAFFRSFHQLSLFLAAFLQFPSPKFLASSITPSSHLSFALPLCLLPCATATRTLLAGLCSSSQMTCPAHLRRLIFVYVTISLAVFTMQSFPYVAWVTSTLFSEIVQRIVEVVCWCLGTTFRSHVFGFLIPEDGTDRLSQNVGIELTLYVV